MSDDRIRIFDTTLRDGEQSPGCSMDLTEKVRLARRLQSLGVDIIEAGFPISSDGDFEAVKAVAAECREDEQPQCGRRVERARRAQRPRGEEQRIARQKRRDHEARFGEHDREQQRIHPRPVGADEFKQVTVAVEEEIEQQQSLVPGSWALVRP